MAYADGFRQIQEELADRFLVGLITEEPLRTWTSRMMVRTVVAAVLEWVEVGDSDGDDAFVEKATTGIRALVNAVAIH